LHGALLDAEILADVYLMMTGGQTVLFMADEVETSSSGADTYIIVRLPVDRPRLRVVAATQSELERHGAMLDDIDRRARQGSVWRSQALALAD
jgi:DNA polymerase-3 subunit epsilon